MVSGRRCAGSRPGRPVGFHYPPAGASVAAHGIAYRSALIDRNGERVTSEDMRGELTIYNFTYTHCGDGCPKTSAVMKEMQELLHEVETQGIPVQFVTISSIPHDAPERLKRVCARSWCG